MSWERIDLGGLEERGAITPSIEGLVYPGRRHIWSGPPESAKTFGALCVAISQIRKGKTVLHIDFEMFAYETRDRLRDMGVTDSELERFVHIEPNAPATAETIAALVDRWKPALVIIDAAAGAYYLHNLDDNSRKDAEAFSQTMLDPFRALEVATITLDHVVKASELRGAFAIGSERKVGGADVHLGFEVITPFGRGRTGLFRIITHKDRFGHLARPHAAELELRSDPDTFAVTWTLREPSSAKPDKWMPTTLMKRASRHLQSQTGPVSRNKVEKAVGGNRKHLREAMDNLVELGYAKETPGQRQARLLTFVEAYEETSPTSPDLAPTSPEAKSHPTSPTSPTPPSGGRGARRGRTAHHHSRPRPKPSRVTTRRQDARLLRIARGNRVSAAPRPRPRLALTPDEAADALGVSRDFFDHHILPELRVVRRGRRRLIPVRELDRWLEQNAATALRNGQI